MFYSGRFRIITHSINRIRRISGLTEAYCITNKIEKAAKIKQLNLAYV